VEPIVVEVDRDWIDYVLVAVTILAGFASLAAVGLAKRALDQANSEAAAVGLDRDRAYKREYLAVLDKLMATVNEWQRTGQAHTPSWDEYRSTIHSTLSAYGLRGRLKKTYAMTRENFPGGSVPGERFDALRKEIGDLVEQEADRANADALLGNPS
jgi:hypothetical protein